MTRCSPKFALALTNEDVDLIRQRAKTVEDKLNLSIPVSGKDPGPATHIGFNKYSGTGFLSLYPANSVIGEGPHVSIEVNLLEKVTLEELTQLLQNEGGGFLSPISAELYEQIKTAKKSSQFVSEIQKNNETLTSTL